MPIKGRKSIQIAHNFLLNPLIKETWYTLDPLLREVRLNRIEELATDLLTNEGKKGRRFRTSEVEKIPETKKAVKNWCVLKIILRHKLFRNN